MRRAETGKGSFLQQAVAEVRDAWLQSGLLDMTRDKIIIYVRTRNEAKDLASMLDCGSYIADSGSPDEKKELLIRWTRSPERPYIVATAALAEGLIRSAHLGRHVIHFNPSAIHQSIYTFTIALTI